MGSGDVKNPYRNGIKAVPSSMFLEWPPSESDPAQKHSPGQDPTEKARRDQIRKILLDDAKKNFETIAPLADNDYSKQLKKLEGDINGYLKRHPEAGARAVVLEPNEFDAGVAMGMKPEEVVTRMLKKQGVTATDDEIKGIVTQIGADYTSKFGLQGYTQVSTQNPVGQGPDRASVIVPNSDQDDPYSVPGLTYAENIDNGNRHEGWHNKDSFYDPGKWSERSQNIAEDYTNPALRHSNSARNCFAEMQKQESIADVGAVGDMIREEKKPLDIIDKVAKWRQTSEGGADAHHMTAQVLQGMRQEIEAMGVDKFRKMNENQVRDFYHDVTEKYGATGASVKAGLDYRDGTPEERAALEKRAAAEPEVKKGLEFQRMMDNMPPVASDDLTAADKELKEKIDKFDASALLEQKAFDLKGKITPATMIEAYGKIEQDLRKKIKSDPANARLYELEMTKLQEKFVHDVNTKDYVEANKKHGVNIEEREPVLSKFGTAPPVNTVPSGTQPTPTEATPEHSGHPPAAPRPKAPAL